MPQNALSCAPWQHRRGYRPAIFIPCCRNARIDALYHGGEVVSGVGTSPRRRPKVAWIYAGLPRWTWLCPNLGGGAQIRPPGPQSVLEAPNGGCDSSSLFGIVAIGSRPMSQRWEAELIRLILAAVSSTVALNNSPSFILSPYPWVFGRLGTVYRASHDI